MSVRLKILWGYYNNPKKEADIAHFRAFCAIKSMSGDKRYIKTNKSLVIERMFVLAYVNGKKEPRTN